MIGPNAPDIATPIVDAETVDPDHQTSIRTGSKDNARASGNVSDDDDETVPTVTIDAVPPPAPFPPITSTMLSPLLAPLFPTSLEMRGNRPLDGLLRASATPNRYTIRATVRPQPPAKPR